MLLNIISFQRKVTIVNENINYFTSKLQGTCSPREKPWVFFFRNDKIPRNGLLMIMIQLSLSVKQQRKRCFGAFYLRVYLLCHQRCPDCDLAVISRSWNPEWSRSLTHETREHLPASWPPATPPNQEFLPSPWNQQKMDLRPCRSVSARVMDNMRREVQRNICQICLDLVTWEIHLWKIFVKSKNIERGRNSSCYIALCAKSVGNFTTVTDRQLFGLGNLWFYTFIKDFCLEKCYSIYLVKIIQHKYSQNVKKQQHYFIAKLMEALCWLPTDSAWPQLLLATQILLL